MIRLLTSLLVLIALTNPANAATASYYAGKFHGKKTASGERYNMNALTAAHNSYPFGTRVLVTNLSNKKSVTVRINDRGGFGKYGRSIDLSRKANQIINCNLCKVKLKVIN